MPIPLLQVNNVVKQFPGVTALDNVSLELNSGEVLCLVGENGAGKSTLIKILAGVFPLTAGEVLLDGKKVNVKKPHDALGLGFSVVYQEHRLLKNLTVAENIYFGRFPIKKAGIVDFKKLNRDTQIVLDKLGMGIKANKRVSELNASQSQMVEIAKALSIGSRIMILDEPSAAITDSELENLFKIIKMLKKEGKSFIYISHRLKEIFEIGDRVVVLKDGKNAGTDDVKNLDVDKIVSMMVGRDIGKVFKPKDRELGE